LHLDVVRTVVVMALAGLALTLSRAIWT
jgi:hypothetical protein